MVLHVIKSNIYSGAENVVCQILKGLSDREDFVYMAPHGPIEDKLKALDLYDCYRGIESLTVAEIQKAVDELHPDVVQAHDFTASVLCGFALKGRVKLISHIHCNPLWLKNRFHVNSISYLIASKWFSQIVAVSDSVAKEYVYSSKLKCPITTLGNPFSINKVLEASDKLDEGENDSDLTSDILYVGRFNEAKNPLGAIKIFEGLADKRNLKFKMVGNGELLEACQGYTELHGLSDNISFEGFQDNVYKYMTHTKLILMPSIFEGFGLVAVEAMALGKPVVCSGVGGLSDIIDETCGYICKDPRDYWKAINELLTDQTIYSSKSETAVKVATRFDNLETYLDTLYKIYKG